MNFLDKVEFRSSLESIALVLKICDNVFDLHDKRIVHGDLNPGNFLVEGGNPELLDFGSSFFLDKQGKATEYVGEGNKAVYGEGYGAPEIMKQRTHITRTKASDIFSLGMVLKKSLEGTPLMDNPEIIQFLNDMTAENPEDRPTQQTIKNFFRRIQQSLLPISHTTVGLLNVSEYVNSTSEEKTHYLNGLRATGEVVLFNTEEKGSEVSALDLELLKRDLRDNNINIRAKEKTNKTAPVETLLVVVPTSHDIQSIPKFLEQNDSPHHVVMRSYFQVSKDPILSKNIHPLVVTPLGDTEKYRAQINRTLDKEIVTVEHREKIISKLQQERNLLANKSEYKNPTSRKGKIIAERIKIIDAAIADLPNISTYSGMIVKINHLAKEMQPTSWLRNILPIAWLTPRGGKQLAKTSQYAQTLRNQRSIEVTGPSFFTKKDKVGKLETVEEKTEAKVISPKMVKR